MRRPQNLHHTPADSAPIAINEPSIESSVNQKNIKNAGVACNASPLLLQQLNALFSAAFLFSWV